MQTLGTLIAECYEIARRSKQGFVIFHEANPEYVGPMVGFDDCDDTWFGCDQDLLNHADRLEDALSKLVAHVKEHGIEHTWYGLAPHVHDFTRTGTFINSTVFTPPPEAVTPGEEYEVEPGLFFKPDVHEDGDGMGIWRQVWRYTPSADGA